MEKLIRFGKSSNENISGTQAGLTNEERALLLKCRISDFEGSFSKNREKSKKATEALALQIIETPNFTQVLSEKEIKELLLLTLENGARLNNELVKRNESS